MKYLHENFTNIIIKAFYEVYNNLGFGFLEKVYENALYKELKAAGLKCEKQVPIKVKYKDEIVGDYFADLLVEDKVIIELKAADKLSNDHTYQLINYLKWISLPGN